MENTEYEIDLRDIFNVLKKRWLMICSITATSVIIAGVISFFLFYHLFMNPHQHY